LDIKVIFGGILRKLRKEKGIAQEELAFESDLDRSYISKLETGIYQPSLSTLIAIADVFEVPADKLVKKVVGHLKQQK